MHHAYLSGLNQLHMIDMMLECITGELLTGVAFLHHHDDKGRYTLKYHAALKGLTDRGGGSRC